jgi:hypothetical protein
MQMADAQLLGRQTVWVSALLFPNRHAGLGNASVLDQPHSGGQNAECVPLTPVKAVPASAQAKGSMYQGAWAMSHRQPAMEASVVATAPHARSGLISYTCRAQGAGSWSVCALEYPRASAGFCREQGAEGQVEILLRRALQVAARAHHQSRLPCALQSAIRGTAMGRLRS